MFGLARFLAKLHNNQPMLEDLVVQAFGAAPDAPRGGLPPIDVLADVMRDVHLARLEKIGLAGYFAGDLAREYFELPENVDGVRGRAARERLRDEFAARALGAYHWINEEVAAARVREKRRYRKQLEFVIFLYKKDKPEETDDEDTVGSEDSETESE